MLAFLDSFCQALCARDSDTIRRWLRHPLAGALPAAVRGEAFAIARAGPPGHLAPTRTFHFYYQTLQLLTAAEGSGVRQPSGQLRRSEPHSHRVRAGTR